MSLPPGLSAYRFATNAIKPFASAWLERRAKRGKEDPSRLSERFGITAAPRPPGPLVWMHGASVGEVKVVLQVLAALSARRPDLRFLVTSGTRTSADVAAKTAPTNARHQFAPLDDVDSVRRFLVHWRPDVAVFAESELWPNTILETAATGARLALVNARMSLKSQANWSRTPNSARRLLSAFSVVSAAEPGTAQALTALGADQVEMLGNLKLAAAPLPAPGDSVAALKAAIGGRPVWCTASTHAREDEIALSAHAALREARPDALLILAPRHPERGAAIAALAENAPRRAAGEAPRTGHPVYVADTIGEMGVLFAASPVTVMGGSLIEGLKGHNPIEPSLLGSATFSGPHVESFADIYADLIAADGVVTVRSINDIAAAVAAAWADPAAAKAQADRAGAVIARGAPALAMTVERLLALLPEAAHATA